MDGPFRTESQMTDLGITMLASIIAENVFRVAWAAVLWILPPGFFPWSWIQCGFL